MADKYTLPELPYDYSALEPHISGKIMEIHHDKHHNTYVNGANSALEKLAEARENDDFGAINQYTRDLSFNLGGHINHSIFWKGLSPDGGGTPQGDLADAIKQDFGSFEAFQKQFTNVATGVQGSGWAVLAYDTVGKRLVTFQLYDQANTVPLGTYPIFQLDMWEHAYYLDYLNMKADYVKAIWNIVNWEEAGKRLEAITQKGEDMLIR